MIGKSIHKIVPDLDILDNLHKNFKWIPSSQHIRPSPDILEKKHKHFEQVNRWYESIKDYILIEIFDLKQELSDSGKLKTSFSIKTLEKKLLRNRFPYQLPKGTQHYVMWYYGNIELLNENDIDTDIKLNLQYLFPSSTLQFIWYENPKMNIPEVYHVQVFLTDINT